MGKEIGIDFGTTTTEVSYIDRRGHARAMKLEAGSTVIPTVLYFRSEDDYCIGKKAAMYGATTPEACVKNFKLFFNDPTKKYRVRAENGDTFSVKPVKAAQLFLNALIQIIQPRLLHEFGESDGAISNAVITVPAQFDPEEKAAVKNAICRAAENAGFSHIKVAAEPTAAAIAYQEENREDGETILVYDFGGGTFDVSIIRRNGEIYTELATDGDKHLGGNLLTEKLAKVLWEKCLSETGRDYPFEQEEADHYSPEDYGLSYERFWRNRNAVFTAAEDMKIDFAEEEEATQTVAFYTDDEGEPRLLELHMDEDRFNAIIRKDIEKTIDLTRRVLDEAKTHGGVAGIDEIVLAGGSSQIRLIREMLTDYEDLCELVSVSAEASTLIARGAAYLASKELKSEEKTRFEIGTRVIDGKRLDVFRPVIRVGEALPCSGSQLYYLSRANQSEVTVEYYEKDAKNYPDASRIDDEGINLINELTISGIPPLPDLTLRVTFQIELDGTPSIFADILDCAGNTVLSDHLSITSERNVY